jgi:hypothetical protein
LLGKLGVSVANSGLDLPPKNFDSPLDFGGRRGDCFPNAPEVRMRRFYLFASTGSPADCG